MPSHLKKHRLSGFVLCFLVLGCTACGDGSVSPPSIFDDDELPVWQLHEAPEWAIGGEDTRVEYQLSGVRGAVIMEDRIAVADAGSREVRFYGLDGELVTRSGGRGVGPGEYASIGRVDRYRGDTVAVWDQQARRMTLVASNGRIVGTATPDFEGARSIFLTWVGTLPDGRMVFRDDLPTSSLREAAAGVRRDSVDLLVLDRSGAPTGIRHRVRGPELQLWRDSGDGVWAWGTTPILFGRSTFSIVSGGGLVVAFNDSLEFKRLEDPEREDLHTVLPWIPPPVSVADVEDERRRMLDEERSRTERAPSLALINGEPLNRLTLSARERTVASLVHRDTEPAFSEIRGDALGRTWIQRVRANENETRRWVVLSCHFEPVARLDIPALFTLLAVGVDAVLLLSQDDLGLESVELFRIDRPTDGGEDGSCGRPPTSLPAANQAPEPVEPRQTPGESALPRGAGYSTPPSS